MYLFTVSSVITTNCSVSHFKSHGACHHTFKIKEAESFPRCDAKLMDTDTFNILFQLHLLL